MISKLVIFREIFFLLDGANQQALKSILSVEIVGFQFCVWFDELTLSFPVPSRSSNKILPSSPVKQNGNHRQSKKTVVSPPSSTDSSYSPTTMDEKNNNLTTKIDKRPTGIKTKLFSFCVFFY